MYYSLIVRGHEKDWIIQMIGKYEACQLSFSCRKVLKIETVLSSRHIIRGVDFNALMVDGSIITNIVQSDLRLKSKHLVIHCC